MVRPGGGGVSLAGRRSVRVLGLGVRRPAAVQLRRFRRRSLPVMLRMVLLQLLGRTRAPFLRRQRRRHLNQDPPDLEEGDRFRISTANAVLAIPAGLQEDGVERGIQLDVLRTEVTIAELVVGENPSGEATRRVLCDNVILALPDGTTGGDDDESIQSGKVLKVVATGVMVLGHGDQAVLAPGNTLTIVKKSVTLVVPRGVDVLGEGSVLEEGIPIVALAV